MILPDSDIQHAVDSLIGSNLSFALYRLPWTDECRLVWQTSGDVERLDDIEALNGRKGFVMAPFRRSEEHPLVMIRPDVVVDGWEEMNRAFSSPEGMEALKACRSVRKEVPTLSTEEADMRRYAEAFRLFIAPLREGLFRKLVLSRPAVRAIGEGHSLLEAFVRACNSYPRMMIYLCHTPVSGTWMGCTPEILLSGHGKEWHTVALAGTMPMKDGMMPTGWSDKNKEEQCCVADYIRRIVKQFGSEVVEKGPYTARAGQLVHLKTDFTFRLEKDDAPGKLLRELHPTPAVCGLPKEEAFRFISEHEGYDRKYYSGFVGWLDSGGHTNIYVNLRCMEVVSGKATFYAGGGILPQSELELEWEETGEKMKTVRNL